MGTSTNSPLKYNLANTVISLKDEVIKSFILAPSSVLELKIKFDAPSLKNLEQWPLV